MPPSDWRKREPWDLKIYAAGLADSLALVDLVFFKRVADKRSICCVSAFRSQRISCNRRSCRPACELNGSFMAAGYPLVAYPSTSFMGRV